MKPYFATTEYTTVASAVLTLLHSFDTSIPLTQEEEFRIWQQTTILPTRASSIFALAKVAKSYGANARIVVENEEYEFPDYRFYRYSKADVDSAKLSAQLLREAARNVGVPIEVKEFSLEDVNKELSTGHSVLLRLNVKELRGLKRNSSNYVILHSFDGSHYSMIDTGDTARSVPKELIAECFETLASKKHRDHRMLIFSNK